MIQSPDEISSVLKQAFDIPGPVLVGVHVDVRDNRRMFEQVNERSIH
jgi:acetolactate synthase-1/2/3 large subunit